jgi:hypothetical protein
MTPAFISNELLAREDSTPARSKKDANTCVDLGGDSPLHTAVTMGYWGKIQPLMGWWQQDWSPQMARWAFAAHLSEAMAQYAIAESVN